MKDFLPLTFYCYHNSSNLEEIKKVDKRRAKCSKEWEMKNRKFIYFFIILLNIVGFVCKE